MSRPRLRMGRPCLVDDCDRIVDKTGGYGYCGKHYQRFRTHGDPMVVAVGGASMPGPLNPNWSGNEPSYFAAHLRIRSTRGPAREHSCVDCRGPARHWSYDHRDRNELVDPKCGRYSGDPAFYEPRCVPCHSRFDRAARTALLTGERTAR